MLPEPGHRRAAFLAGLPCHGHYTTALQGTSPQLSPFSKYWKLQQKLESVNIEVTTWGTVTVTLHCYITSEHCPQTCCQTICPRQKLCTGHYLCKYPCSSDISNTHTETATNAAVYNSSTCQHDIMSTCRHKASLIIHKVRCTAQARSVCSSHQVETLHSKLTCAETDRTWATSLLLSLSLPSTMLLPMQWLVLPWLRLRGGRRALTGRRPQRPPGGASKTLLVRLSRGRASRGTPPEGRAVVQNALWGLGRLDGGS